MPRQTISSKTGNVLEQLGIREPDVELAKADLATRIHRLTEHRRLTVDEAASLLNVSKSEVPDLFRGRLATCSLDQLLRMLTWLGDDVEILIRPRLQRTKRGALRVLQAAALDKPDDFEPVRWRRATRLSTNRRDAWDEKADPGIQPTPSVNKDDTQLLNKHAVERMTSLDITTIYRKMAAGQFPQPVRVGRRRVAWRTSDVVKWQQALEVGTETVRWNAGRSPEGGRRRGTSDRNDRP